MSMTLEQLLAEVQAQISAKTAAEEALPAPELRSLYKRLSPHGAQLSTMELQNALREVVQILIDKETPPPAADLVAAGKKGAM